MRAAIVLALAMFAANTIHANSACNSVINQISKDISKHPESLNPQNFQWLNSSWLIKNLGEPQIKNITDNLIQYTWSCKDLFASTLAIQIAGKNIIRVEGQYNSDNGTEMFSALIAPKTRNPFKNETAFAKQKPIDAKELNTLIHSLQKCTPGTYLIHSPVTNSAMYKLANQPDNITTYKISGLQNDRCIVDTVMPDKSSSHCLYTQDSIRLIIKAVSNPQTLQGKASEDLTNVFQDCH